MGQEIRDLGFQELQSLIRLAVVLAFVGPLKGELEIRIELLTKDRERVLEGSSIEGRLFAGALDGRYCRELNPKDLASGGSEVLDRWRGIHRNADRIVVEPGCDLLRVDDGSGEAKHGRDQDHEDGSRRRRS